MKAITLPRQWDDPERPPEEEDPFYQWESYLTGFEENAQL